LRFSPSRIRLPPQRRQVIRSLPGSEGTLKRTSNHGEGDARAQSSGAEAQGGLKGDKYQRILDAAIEVIAENGYFNSPVSAIAARAGVADGTIYLYFKNKDHVLRTAIDSAFKDFFARVREALAPVSGAREQLHTVARLQLETLAAHRSLAIVMQTEVRQSAKFIAEFSHQHLVDYLNLVREIVRKGQQEGVFRPEIPDRVVAHCLFGALDEMVSSWVFTGRAFDPQTTAAQLLDVILNGVAENDPGNAAEENGHA